MMIPLRQSTAGQKLRLSGQFVNDTDFKTPLTALAIAPADVLIQPHGILVGTAKHEASNATHVSNGFYGITVDATDTATLGAGSIIVAKTGSLSSDTHFIVYPPAIYDAIFVGGSALLPVDVKQVEADTNTADLLVDLLSTWSGGALPATLDATQQAGIATKVEQQIMDETDSRAVLAAIVAKINATDTNLAGLSTSAIATAVWAAAGRALSVTPASQSSVDALAAVAAAIKIVTDLHNGMFDTSTPRKYTPEALENAPTVSGGAGGDEDLTIEVDTDE